MTMYHQAMAGTLGALDSRASSTAYPKDVTIDCRSLSHKLLHAPLDGQMTASWPSTSARPKDVVTADARSGPTTSMFGPNPK